MSEQVLGVIRLKNPKIGRSKFEAMFLTKDKIIVAPVCSGAGVIGGFAGGIIYTWLDEKRARPKIDEAAKSPLNELLSQEGTYSIPLSEIKNVELMKLPLSGEIFLRIDYEGKKHVWICEGIPEVKKSKYDDYKKMLQLAFGGMLKAK
jgi:hypothetical protein